MLQRFRQFVRTNNLLRMHRTEVLHVENCAKCARTLFQSSFSPGPIGNSKFGRKKFEIEKSQVEVDGGDVFGDIPKDVHEKISSDFMFEEDDDDEQDRHEAKVSDIYRPGKQFYLRRINDLLNERNDLKGALDVLEIEMKEELVQPEQPHYRVLIHACAKAGHLLKALSLHREFKERGLKFHIGIYTDLFLACTNSHSRELGLEKATSLLNEIREKHINPNRVLYNSIIQAFGRCGDLRTALNLVDEMNANKFSLSSQSFNFLLQGCISDKESGFRHALLVWRNMRRKRIQPDIHSFNLMLRAANDCKLGDGYWAKDILLESVHLKDRENMEQKLLTAAEDVEVKTINANKDIDWWDLDIKQSQESNLVKKMDSRLPSLLEASPNLENVVSLRLEDTPKNRLMLLGDINTVIRTMQEEKVRPILKTLQTLLLNLNTAEAERTVLSLVEELDIQPTTEFYNQVIRQRALRFDYEGGISTLSLITEKNLKPDIITFGCLAMCCSSLRTGLKLLSDLNKYGAKPNTEIMGTLIKGAGERLNPRDVRKYLEIVRSQKILVNKTMLNHLHKFYNNFRHNIKIKENGGYVPYAVVQDMKNGYEEWKEFTRYYKDWLVEVKLEENRDPLDQFKTTKEENKEKEEKKEKKRIQMERREKFKQKNEFIED